MSISNAQIAAIFLEIAESLEATSANHYRARAYRNAANVIEKISPKLCDLVTEGKDLTIFPGIGKALAGKITQIVHTGEMPTNPSLQKHFPSILNDLVRIPKLGRKRLRTIFNTYSFYTLAEFRELLRSRKISQIKGFSTQFCQEILSYLERIHLVPKRLYWSKAEPIVAKLLNYLKKHPDIAKVEVAGSFRRKKETVGNINIVVAATEKALALNHLIQYPETIQIISQTETEITVEFFAGLLVHMVVTPIDNFGAALYCYTGSKIHVQNIEQLIKTNKINVNLTDFASGTIKAKTESEFIRLANLPQIPPELRENQNTFIKNVNTPLPNLIQLHDILGDLHCHTASTDGKFPLEDMVMAAQKKGYQYLAITDHSQSLTITNGLDPHRLLEQIKLIDKLNAQLTNFTILKSIEVDILADGSLDLPNDILKELDITVCSVHSKFRLSKIEQTERIIRAMDNPYFNILGHATGRLINHREPYEIDIEQIIDAAKERNCILEINSQPARLDIHEVYAKMAKDKGVLMAISSDAHNIRQLDLVRLGINQARRAWLEAKDVINTRPLKELKKIVRRV